MDNSKYYEVYDWTKFTNADHNCQVISSMIPEGVQSIIDVGCGNGLITNVLAEKYKVLGVDRSKAALELVTGDKLESSCDDIAVADKSFDLALTSELLEHLEEDVYRGTVKELKRIASDYILISVPFRESLNKGNIQCPECKLIYHRCYHMRVFSVESIAADFPEFTVVSSREFGKKVRVYNPVIGRIKQKLTSSSSWIPFYWTKKGDRDTLCPKCETKFAYPFKFNPIAFACDCLNVMITRKIPFHLAVLLKRKS